MSYDKNLTHSCFSDLEKNIKELTDLLVLENEKTNSTCKESLLIAQIEREVYSSIKIDFE